MRLFIATTFPASATRELNVRVQAVRPRLPPASWVKPESQHLTFAFLGEQDESIIDRITPQLASQLQEIAAFKAALQGCGFFPNRRRARVGCTAVEPEQPLIDIASAVRNIVVSAGVALDRAGFTPHLTLMRIRENWPPASIELFEKTFCGYRSELFTVDTVMLYSSELNPKGAIHTPLRKFALK